MRKFVKCWLIILKLWGNFSKLNYSEILSNFWEFFFHYFVTRSQHFEILVQYFEIQGHYFVKDLFCFFFWRKQASISQRLIKCIYATAFVNQNKCLVYSTPGRRKSREIKRTVSYCKPPAVHAGSERRSTYGLLQREWEQVSECLSRLQALHLQ